MKINFEMPKGSWFCHLCTFFNNSEQFIQVTKLLIQCWLKSCRKYKGKKKSKTSFKQRENDSISVQYLTEVDNVKIEGKKIKSSFR